MYLASYHGSPGFFKSIGKFFKKALPVAIGFATGGPLGAAVALAGSVGPGGAPPQQMRAPVVQRPRMGQSGFYNIFGKKQVSLTRLKDAPLMEFGRAARVGAQAFTSPLFILDKFADKALTTYTARQMRILSAQQRSAMGSTAMPYFTSAQKKAFSAAAGRFIQGPGGPGIGGIPPGFPMPTRAGRGAAFAPKRKRMNVANPKALRRAIRRQAGFVKLARRALKGSGYRIVSAGSRRPSIKIQESGPGGVVVQK